MIKFYGKYYDGETSKSMRVSVSYDGQNISLTGDDLLQEIIIPLADCRLPPALGTTNRAILLPDGGKCETNNLSAINRLDEKKGGNPVYKIIHMLEQRWRLTISCMAGLILVVFLFALYGIPVFAEVVSRNIPAAVMNRLSDDALLLLDKQIFEPTKLELSRQRELTANLGAIQNEIHSGRQYNLKFRSGTKVGANAFALPSGTIIITDELIEMVEEERELTGIILHEIGHIEKRHGIRSVLQNTGIFFLISAIVGDMVSITSVAGSFPTLLVESGYSRKFEKEADQFSADFFIGKGWSTQPIQNILKRITKDNDNGVEMVSTHPGIGDRIKFLQSLDKNRD